MSSVVIQQGSQGDGFVVSADSIVYKYPTQDGKVIGKVKGITHKLFQLHDDILVAAIGNWGSYFPMLNTIAASHLSKLQMLDEIRNQGIQIGDAKIYLLYRNEGKVLFDIVENGKVRPNQLGAWIYPEPILNSIFKHLEASSDIQAIKRSGMLGIAAYINAYNAFALSLCSDIAAPFDTVIFSRKGFFIFSGGVTNLPVDIL